MKPAIGRAVASWLPSPVLGWLRRARNALFLAYERRRYRFTYSREFYEEGYHEKLAEHTGSTLARLGHRRAHQRLGARALGFGRGAAGTGPRLVAWAGVGCGRGPVLG